MGPSRCKPRPCNPSATPPPRDSLGKRLPGQAAGWWSAFTLFYPNPSPFDLLLPNLVHKGLHAARRHAAQPPCEDAGRMTTHNRSPRATKPARGLTRVTKPGRPPRLVHAAHKARSPDLPRAAPCRVTARGRRPLPPPRTPPLPPLSPRAGCAAHKTPYAGNLLRPRTQCPSVVMQAPRGCAGCGVLLSNGKARVAASGAWGRACSFLRVSCRAAADSITELLRQKPWWHRCAPHRRSKSVTQQRVPTLHAPHIPHGTRRGEH